jgi:hypothetical protein
VGTERILLCTLGTTPQIATETVWALLNQEKPWRPDRIEIVTTGGGLRVMLEGFEPLRAALAALFPGGMTPPVSFFALALDDAVRRLDWPGGAAAAPVLPPAAGLMRDVSGPRETYAIGDLIKARIDDATARPETELHVSIAGGRKTMSAQALLSLSLLGRPQDEASHVLVEPPFEDNRHFWHPDQPGGPIHTARELLDHARDPERHPLPAPSLVPAEARDRLTLMRVPIPYVAEIKVNRERLRALSFEEISRQLDHARLWRLKPEIRFDDETRGVTVLDITARLPEKSYVILRILATARAEGWAGAGPEGQGWLSFDMMVGQPGGPQTRFARELERYSDTFRAIRSEEVARTVLEMIGKHRESPRRIPKSFTGKLKDPIYGELFRWTKSMRFSDLREQLEKAFGQFTANLMLGFSGEGFGTAVGLTCPPKAIRFD